MRALTMLLYAVAVVVLLGTARQQVTTTRYYWPVTVAQLASGTVKHTHVRVRGKVVYTRLEDDGDLHIRLVDSAGSPLVFIVAECIPRLPCVRPPLNSMRTALGIERPDAEHLWWEIHPVEELIP